MIYKKCKQCKYVCRCCTSHFMEGPIGCSECARNRNEFSPAMHIVYCPVDGRKITHPLYDINGRLVREE